MRFTSNFGFIRLVKLAAPRRALFAAGLAALFIGSGISLLFPEVIRRIVNEDGARLLFERPAFTAGLVVALFVFQAVFFYIRSYIFGVIGHRTVFDIRDQLYRSLLRQPLEFFDARATGDLVSRLNSDCAALQDAVSIKLSVLIRYGIQVFVGILLMAWLSPRLTVALLLLLPVLVLVSIFLGRRLKAHSKLLQQELGQASAVAEETISTMRIVRAFGRTEHEASRFNISLKRLLKHGENRTRVAAFFASFVNLLMNSAIVAVIIYGIALVHAGQLSVGDLTAFLLYGAIVAISFAFLSGAYAELVQAYAAGDRILEILDRPIQRQTGDKQLPKSWNGELEIRNLGFSYPTRAEIAVLHGVSFQVPAGKVTALVGPSGSGKTTLAQLILGLYPIVSGEVLVGAIPIEQLDLERYRERIALVPQEPILFAVSIAENLRYGDPTASLEQLRDACKKARILEFVDSLPEGFETQVGSRGVQLSGGQRQRLAIARAILRNPTLLLLDEATSSLDSENEALVQEALAELMLGRTSVVIAHRLSTVKRADQIVVLEHGKLVERGTHTELSQRTGLYKQLVSLQELS